MTENEFFLRAMLQMASNPNYVKVEPSKENPGVMATVLKAEEIAMDAERLTEMAIKHHCDFDMEPNTPNVHLRTIARNINKHLDKLDTIADVLEHYISAQGY